MKHRLFTSKSFIIAVVFTLSFSSCNKKLDELRDNPNAITVVDDAALFANAARAIFIETMEESNYRFTGQHAHYFVAGGDVRKPDLYGDGFDTYYEDMFFAIYGSGNWHGGVIKNIQDVQVITTTEGTKNKVRYAMADVIRSLGFALLTDEFGEIPYTDGGKGKTENILLPKYDTQEFIYKDLIAKLKSDIEALKTLNTENGYSKSDFIFENDSDKWVRFANSLRLRLAMRLRNSDETFSRATVIECLKEPLMEDNSHNAWMIETEGNGNKWYEHKVGFPGIKVSDMLVKQLSSTNDPRLSIYAAKDYDGGYSGQLNGLNDMEFGKSEFSKRSNMGDLLSSQDSRLYVLTAAETWFLRAEIELAYNNDVTKANDNFKEGIKTSLNQWEVPAADINTFLATSTADLSDPENDFAQIGMQMWLALTPNYTESWSYIRRTGYPVIKQRTDTKLDKGVTNGYIPERFKYSSFEISTNGEYTQEAIRRQGENLITTPIWWSAKK